MTTSSERYGAVAMILHWIMALGILFMLGLGLVMVHGSLDPGTMYRLFQLHKSIGITLLAVALLRVVWRLLHHPPAFPARMSLGEIRLAKLGHALLYMELFFMPLSGWALVSSSVFAIPTVLYGIVPWPDLPFFAHLTNRQPVEDAFTLLHAYGAYALIAVVGLHMMAALRHHFFLRDGVLLRMLPATRRTPDRTHLK